MTLAKWGSDPEQWTPAPVCPDCGHDEHEDGCAVNTDESIPGITVIVAPCPCPGRTP